MPRWVGLCASSSSRQSNCTLYAAIPHAKKSAIAKQLVILICLALFLPLTISAQIKIFHKFKTDSSQIEDPLQQQIEDLSENTQTENADLTTLVENLKYYQDHPLNLNNATREELYDLLILSEIQIDNLLAHRIHFGTLISIYELQAVEGFDLATINKILPFIKVLDFSSTGHFNLKEMLKYGKMKS